jgi:mannose-1-phosphate guanylyltransferase/phosphomannomutase
MKAVFLDRDGTINREVGNLRDAKMLRLLPSVAKAVRVINRMGYLAIVITNQPVVARGWISESGLDEIHAIMVGRFAKKGAKIDAVYYCPHHPDANLKKYRILCRCRKPNPGLIMRAAKEYGIDLKKSFMVGDRTVDILAGKRAGATTILVKTGAAGKDGKYDVKPDFIARNLVQAVNIAKKHAK